MPGVRCDIVDVTSKVWDLTFNSVFEVPHTAKRGKRLLHIQGSASIGLHSTAAEELRTEPRDI